jgi:hypothetical protein
VLDMGEGPDACLYICDMYFLDIMKSHPHALAR